MKEFSFRLKKLSDCLVFHAANGYDVPAWSKNESLMFDMKKLSWFGLAAKFGIEPPNELLLRLRGVIYNNGPNK